MTVIIHSLYLCGPMRSTGRDDLNFPAFHDAAAQLRAAGYHVFNPAEHEHEDDAEYGLRVSVREAMSMDTGWICSTADAIALLPGWGESFGAKAEVALGVAIGIPHDFVSEWIRRAKK